MARSETWAGSHAQASLDVDAHPTLRRDNAVAGAVHLVQAVAVAVLASSFALPVTATYLEGPPGTVPLDPVELVEIPTGAAVSAFLALSALAHALVCTVWWPRYTADLRRSRNAARWVEYALSHSTGY